jgi:hypothetical protein
MTPFTGEQGMEHPWEVVFHSYNLLHVAHHNYDLAGAQEVFPWWQGWSVTFHDKCPKNFHDKCQVSIRNKCHTAAERPAVVAFHPSETMIFPDILLRAKY